MRKPAVKKAVDPTWLTAVRAAEEKKAIDIKVLDLTGVSSFTGLFRDLHRLELQTRIRLSATKWAMRMKKRGELPLSVEGWRSTAEWILTDLRRSGGSRADSEGPCLLAIWNGSGAMANASVKIPAGSADSSKGQTRRQIGLKVFLY